jgi:hypothetical protein
MLDEKAIKEIEKRKEKTDWIQTKLRNVSKLAPNVGVAVRQFVGKDEEGRKLSHAYAHFESNQRRIAEQISKLTDGERKAVFEHLFPDVAQYVEAGWKMFERLPYQEYYGERRPFRAPGHPTAYQKKRVAWVCQLVQILGPLPENITWLAAHAGYISSYWVAEELGILFAAAIDAGGKEGEEVFEILCASGRGDHPIGQMGRHVTSGLLCGSRPEGWEFISKMLLAAQRQEGLRQTILETVDEAHPGAFRLMLKTIREHKLARFSAVVRAADVWLSLMWDSVSVKVINDSLSRIETFLEDKGERDKALQGKNPEEMYFALWSIAFENALAALEPAAALLKHSKPEARFVTTHFLTQVGLPESRQILFRALEDDEQRVFGTAIHYFTENPSDPKDGDHLLSLIEKKIPGLPRKKMGLKPLVWPWEKCSVSQAEAAACMVANLGAISPTRLIPYLPMMDPQSRGELARKLAEQKKWDTQTRDTLFAMLGDASSWVRDKAVDGLAKCKVEPKEAEALEKLLTRNAGDLRRGILNLLLTQKDDDLLQSARRLLAGASEQERVAGLELLRLAMGKKRTIEAAQRAATEFKGRATCSDAEQKQLDAILGGEQQSLTLQNGFGLFDPKLLTTAPQPKPHKILLHSPISLKILRALNGLIDANKELPVKFAHCYEESERQRLLGECTHGFSKPNPELSLEKDLERWPAKDLWLDSWNSRPGELRDKDGFDAVRALALSRSNLETGEYRYNPLAKKVPAEMKSIFGMNKYEPLSYSNTVQDVLEWIVRALPPAGLADFVLDAAETSLSLVPQDRLTRIKKARAKDDPHDLSDATDFEDYFNEESWRDSSFITWFALAQTIHRYHPALWEKAHTNRLWQLGKWIDQPTAGQDIGKRAELPRERVDFAVLASAFKNGAATEADLYDAIVGPTERLGLGFGALEDFTRTKPQPNALKFPFVQPFADRSRDRIIDIELNRGDNPTVASRAAKSINSVWGMQRLGQLLTSIGKRDFMRGYDFSGENKESTLSHLVRRCFPLATETDGDFAAMIKRENVSESRLVELAVYAPQWARFVERALGWNGLEDAIWWIHAHTKGTDWQVGEDIMQTWAAEISRRTPLAPEDLKEGGVDVEWFQRVYAALGKDDWNALYEAAKYAASGVGHTRARIFADAMLGQLNRKELIVRVQKKRHQDSVRALGLLPLAKGDAREKDVLERFKVLQEFIRTSKQFGSQRQASEKRSAALGQENLARTAGYRDPIRLRWSMEAKATSEFGKGPKILKLDDVELRLGIDQWGAVELTVLRGGKTLSDVPAKLKKDSKVAELKEQKSELRRQASRIRPTLENLMCRGDAFSSEELVELCRHPLIAPMIKNLVLIGDEVMGFPVHDGKALEDHSANVEALKKGEVLRIAHPVDFWPPKKWQAWQKDCLARERIQPFKQIFREYYPITQTEVAAEEGSKRYAGHQVNPRQALALLGNRGWTAQAEAGVSKTFHAEGITAALEFQEGFFTPAEVEGLTLEEVAFASRKERKPIPLKNIPPRLFSEVMRDLDLVVSVAHRGGVDPEASASTIEMRANLLRETLSLLKIRNVRLKDSHAFIDGELGQYSVHLGSSGTHSMPGGALFLIPVHSQHRGRLFLPFADDDPKTAEVLSKVLTLARDNEIKDPNILDQIRGMQR